jgi:hypothetical protein
MPSSIEVWALPSAIAFIVYITVTWYGEVLREVPDPYLVSSYRRRILVLTEC